MIVREEDFKKAYLAWDFSLEKKRLINWISGQYGIYRSIPDDVEKGIDFLNTNSSKGFVLHFKEKTFQKEELAFFFDYLKNNFLKAEYRISVSDRRVFNRANYLEKIERHYLKPRHKMGVNEKINQQFGNVSIILSYRDDQAYNLKCSATAYPDRSFAEAKAFDEFMETIME